MGRAEGLTEKQIVALEAELLGSAVNGEGRDAMADTLMGLLRSYRATAQVANAAWKWFQASAAGDVDPAATTVLRKTLHRYAPEHFLPYRSDVEYACWTLEKLYDEWSDEGVSAEVLEDLYTRIEALRKQAALEG